MHQEGQDHQSNYSHNQTPQRGLTAQPRVGGASATNSGSTSRPDGNQGRRLDRASLFARFKYRNLAQLGGSKDPTGGKTKSLSQIQHLLENANPSASAQEQQMWRSSIFNEKPKLPEWSRSFTKNAQGKWVKVRQQPEVSSQNQAHNGGANLSYQQQHHRRDRLPIEQQQRPTYTDRSQYSQHDGYHQNDENSYQTSSDARYSQEKKYPNSHSHQYPNPQQDPNFDPSILETPGAGGASAGNEWDLRAAQFKRQPLKARQEGDYEGQYGQYMVEGMWDDEFSKSKGMKKFELGRVIERDTPQMINGQKTGDIQGNSSADIGELGAQLHSMSIAQKKAAVNTNRIVKTTNIDVFLNCDDMTAEELSAIEREELSDAKHLRSVGQEEEEEDPEWADVNLEEVKKQETLTKAITPLFNQGAHNFQSAQIYSNQDLTQGQQKNQNFEGFPRSQQVIQQQWAEQDDAIISVKRQPAYSFPLQAFHPLSSSYLLRQPYLSSSKEVQP
ncbi:hypothetical protein FGO68_gene4642 [Halteria grandinella]|uniref:Uncharacterized protein n=1 Tax=Halteria grandinella TaxID=5974 RepID=A0A8J8P159_HALGN|nr:hypothetical protein FGO68_gene4642 [Halteria grandinella]